MPIPAWASEVLDALDAASEPSKARTRPGLQRFLKRRRQLAGHHFAVTPVKALWIHFAQRDAFRWAFQAGAGIETTIPLDFARRLRASQAATDLIRQLGIVAHPVIGALYEHHQERARDRLRARRHPSRARWRAARARQRGTAESWIVIESPFGDAEVRIPQGPAERQRPGRRASGPRWRWAAAITEYLWRVTGEVWRGWTLVGELLHDFDPDVTPASVRRLVQGYRRRDPGGTYATLGELRRYVQAALSCPPLPSAARRWLLSRARPFLARL